MITIKDVQVVRSGKVLFKDLNWEIKEGENWIVRGANGSGKSILLQLVAGDVFCSKGKVEYSFLEGASWDDRYQDRKKKIRYVPSNSLRSILKKHSQLFYQQRYYASGNDDIPTVREIFGTELDAVLKLKLPANLNIQSLFDLQVTKLSNGQLKKLLILKKLAQGLPRTLLLDYPYEGLDTDSQHELNQFLDYLSDEYQIRLIIADNSQNWPSVMNRELILDHFQVKSMGNICEQNEGLKAESFTVTGVPNIKSDLKLDSIVQVNDLTYYYGDKVLVDRFNWTVEKGEKWSLLGKNGSGKSTLLSMVFADNPQAYHHDIYLFGKRRGTGETIWDIKNRISYLGPEITTFFRSESVALPAFEYLKRKNRFNKNSPELVRLEEIIAYFGAEDYMLRPVNQLSNGQIQMMYIINCFLQKKELLLLDEPFQFLDHENKKRVKQYLNKVLDKDTTVIMITHFPEDIPDPNLVKQI